MYVQNFLVFEIFYLHHVMSQMPFPSFEWREWDSHPRSQSEQQRELGKKSDHGAGVLVLILLQHCVSSHEISAPHSSYNLPTNRVILEEE